MFKKTNKKNLNLILSLPFVILVIVSFFTASSIMYYGSKNSIYELINKLANESSKNITAHLTHFFETPHLINKINNDAFFYGDIDTKTLFEKPEKFFYKQHFQFSNISDIHFASIDGAICGVDSEDEKYILKVTTNFPNRNFYLLDKNGNREKIVKTNTYDATKRPWFKNTISKNKPLWSDIYIFKNKNKLGISASAPTYNKNGELLGVMGVHITLDNISQFLKETKVSTNSITYMVDKSGALVASSFDENLFLNNEDKEKPQRVQAKDAKNSVISQTIELVNINPEQTEENFMKIKIDNSNYVVKSFNFKDEYGLDYKIIMAIDEKDFMSGVNDIVKLSLVFGIIILFVIICISLIIAKKISKPIERLSIEANSITKGNLGKKVDIDASSSEIQTLVDTFNSMSLQLSESFENLEQNVKDRTKDLEKANNELLLSKNILHEAHKNIQDSINYGSLIQRTLLPEINSFSEYFKDAGVIWMPKDIVGGDIYLFEKLNDDECLIMVIDCTGHGVPGAFVTMLVKAIERQILNQKIVSSPSSILSYFNKTMKYLLKQENEDSVSNAGFDGGIIFYNKKEKILKYSGANTPLFYIRNNELKTIKGDRHSIGYKNSKIDYLFKEHTINVEDGMCFYISSDGYFDQNGGTKGLPYGKKKFEKILLENNHLSIKEQQHIILDNLNKYKEDEEQNDDITILGMRI